MGRKCCVPECKSSKYKTIKISSHKIPKNFAYAEAWLTMIGRTDMIGKPRKELDKLRVCGMHFTPDMIMSYGTQQWLINCALPILYLPIDLPQDNVGTTSSTANIYNLDNLENVACNQQCASTKENNSQ